MWLLRSCASDVESDLTLEMVHIHERLTLIILMRDVTWHLNRKTCLIEAVAASVERGQVKSKVIAGAVGALMNQSRAVSLSYLAVDVRAVADGVKKLSLLIFISFSFRWPVTFMIELHSRPAVFSFLTTIFLALWLEKVFHESSRVVPLIITFIMSLRLFNKGKPRNHTMHAQNSAS